MNAEQRNVKISVVVTAYNMERYIAQCLESLMKQTYRNLEIIVVNDGSKDRTPEILKEFSQRDARIRVIHQENMGGGPARNTGIAAATGDYLSILDGDDFFRETMLEHALEKALETDADITIFDALFYDNVRHTSGKLNTALNAEYTGGRAVFHWKDVPKYIFNISDGFVWNKLYRRSFVEKHGLRFQNVRRIDDLYFEMLALIGAERIAVLQEPLLYYRCNNSGSQQGKAIDTPNTFYLAFMEVKKWLVEQGVYPEVRQSFANRALSSCVNNLELMTTGAAYEKMYTALRSKYLKDLDLEWREDYYYEQEQGNWLRRVLENTPAECLYGQLQEMKALYGIGSHFFALPRERLPRNSRIVIYGAGVVGRSYFCQLLSDPDCSLAGWVDRGYETIGFPVQPPAALRELHYDYVLISVENRDLAETIKRDLITLGVPENRILF